jgi:flagellar basal-body rod protein FlgB
MNWMDSVSMSLLNKDLDGLWTRQQAISDNLANIETPGYKSKSVSFEDQLQQQLAEQGRTKSQQIGGIDGVSPVTTVASDETYRADGNGVDLEKENLEMARTELNYMYSLQMVSDEFSRLRTVIDGGK